MEVKSLVTLLLALAAIGVILFALSKTLLSSLNPTVPITVDEINKQFPISSAFKILNRRFPKKCWCGRETLVYHTGASLWVSCPKALKILSRGAHYSNPTGIELEDIIEWDKGN